MTPIPVIDTAPLFNWQLADGHPVAVPSGANDPLAVQLRRIINERQLHAMFQPVLDMHGQHYLGYEGLIRGPANSPLHSPAALFDVAQRHNLRRELEHACRETVIREFAALKYPGKLFINLSASMLGDPHLMHDEVLRPMAALGVSPERIVIEITENQMVADFSIFREVLARYRKIGYSFAIDDLGEGFSNLRMWSEIRPEFVKIDRHFISGISSDVLKFRLVKAMVEIAEACNATLIAEGIEEESEFSTVRDLGIRCGQGFLIARPAPRPAQDPAAAIVGLLNKGRITVFPQGTGTQQMATIAPLLTYIEPVTPSADNDAAFARFEADKSLHALPVVSNGVPIGMLNRHTLAERFALPYRRELYGKRPCTTFMDQQPLRVERDTPVHEVGSLLGSAARHQIYDGFIITENGRYVGVGNAQDLMVLITEMQIRSARYANPLTQLPGNVPLNEHMVRLLNNAQPFVACYVDISHFKPYNDIYGYRRGDEIIQILGKILSEVCEESSDFVGHIGGDDFALLMQSNDWQARCEAAVRRFDDEIVRFIDEDDLQRGGLSSEDRRGNPTFHPLPQLSIGCVPVTPNQHSSHNEISALMAEAKKQAKKLSNSGLFIERRRTSVTSIKNVKAAISS